VAHIREQVLRHLMVAGDGIRLVVWDLSTSPYVDIAGVRLLGDIQRMLAGRGVALRIVEAHASARDLIRKEIGMSVGEVSRRVSIDDAIGAMTSAGAMPSHPRAQPGRSAPG
jgi:MFS superfamily sulfate permease-like transporter